jgi:hypothetical protein
MSLTKQDLISDFKNKLIKQSIEPLGEFESIELAKKYAEENNIHPTIIISKDNSELLILY